MRLAARTRAYRRMRIIHVAALNNALRYMAIGAGAACTLVLILTAAPSPAPVSTTAATRSTLRLQRAKAREHMRAVRESMSQVTACSQARDCPVWWRARESAMKDAIVAAEQQRLKDHRQLFDGDHLPTSSLPVRDVMAMLHDRRNLAPLIRWASDYSCGEETRLPVLRTGDGYKWVCGAIRHTQPCTVLSLGSAGDDGFERALQDASGCVAYIVDPTLDDARLGNHQMSAASARTFAARVRERGFSLNGTVGVGGSLAPLGGAPPFPVVTLDRLIADHYRLPAHISVVKIDIEGHEWGVLLDLAAMCRAGTLSLDSLHVELHLDGAAPALTFGALHSALAGPRACGLILHHTDPNMVGCSRNGCAEFSWVSLAHARRVEAAEQAGQAGQAEQAPSREVQQASSHEDENATAHSRRGWRRFARSHEIEVHSRRGRRLAMKTEQR